MLKIVAGSVVSTVFFVEADVGAVGDLSVCGTLGEVGDEVEESR